MAKQPEKALFEYLRDILYRTDYACLDMAEIPEAFKPLAQGLHWLHQCVKEQKAFGEDLAQGDLDATPPGVENTLAAPLKAVQGSLKHIAWQARQLPKGDYGQHIDYMGEFADILNTMVDQLAAQHQALLDEKHLVEEQNKILGQYYSLFLSLTESTDEAIIVLDEKTGKPQYLNPAALVFEENYGDRLDVIRYQLGQVSEENLTQGEPWILEIEADGQKSALYLRVVPHSLGWNGRDTIVHVIRDKTDERQKEAVLSDMVYRDALTGLYNRRYGMEKVEEWIAEGYHFTISFIDIDDLKTCNDAFGHDKGDEYICLVATTLKGCSDHEVICRMGGDEFLLLTMGGQQEQIDGWLEKRRQWILSQQMTGVRGFRPCFSYGTSVVSPGWSQDADYYLGKADHRMYEYKRVNKIR